MNLQEIVKRLRRVRRLRVSKYVPHDNVRERNRRVRQAAAGKLEMAGSSDVRAALLRGVSK